MNDLTFSIIAGVIGVIGLAIALSQGAPTL